MITRTATVLAAALALCLPAVAQARTRHVRDEGKLHFVKSSGSQIIDEGPARGELPGLARVRFTYNGSPTVYASFTISGHGWSISGRASGRLANPNSPTPSFRGKLTITAGSGTYRHASGSGELFGVFYRRSYALTVQTIGTLSY
jgi:hypothetical protein